MSLARHHLPVLFSLSDLRNDRDGGALSAFERQNLLSKLRDQDFGGELHGIPSAHCNLGR